MKKVLFLGDKRGLSGYFGKCSGECGLSFDFSVCSFVGGDEPKKIYDKIPASSYSAAVFLPPEPSAADNYAAFLRNKGIKIPFWLIDTKKSYDSYQASYESGFDMVMPFERELDTDLFFMLSKTLSGSLKRDETKNAGGFYSKEISDFRSFFNAAHEVIIITDLDERIIDANRSAIKLFGYSKDEFLRMTIHDLMMPDEIVKCDKRKEAGLGEEVNEMEIEFINKKGIKILCEVNLTPLCYNSTPALMGTIRDISERRATEETLRLSLKEKTYLLQEVHHRVKNNLQLIISMINLQILDDEDGVRIPNLRDIENRIQVMSLVHENLYCSGSFSSIDAREHIFALASTVINNMNPENDILFKYEIGDLKIPVKVAVPISLSINELITNSIKYAFENGNHKEISIKAGKTGDGVRFVVSDNGKGMPEDFSFDNTESFGLSIVRGLICIQLEGEVILNREKGTEWEINIPDKEFCRYL